MDDELKARMDALEHSVQELHRMTKRMYTFFLWTVIATGVAFVLPLIGLAFVIPSFISTYANIGDLQ